MDKSDTQMRAALSPRRPAWQSAAAALALLTAAMPAPAPAAGPPPGSDPALGFGGRATLRLGHFACEMPGDVGSDTAIAQPEVDFDIRHASVYTTRDGEGAYLVVNGIVTMTNGPLANLRFRRVSVNFLRQINADGSDARMRCVRQVRNNR